jgi:glucan phosphorylase
MPTKDELINQVNGELVDLGNKLKKNLWTEEDKKVLLQRAADLVSLNSKAELAEDPAKKEQYKLAAKMVLQHVQSMALLKMLIAEQATLEAMKNLLWELLIKILSKYLLALL